MVAIRIDSFGGMQPSVDARLIPEKAASYAQNVWLYSGRLEATRVPSLAHTPITSGVTTAYRIPTDYTISAELSDAFWMEFTNPFTTVLRAPVVGDTFERYYWCAPNVPAPMQFAG